MHVITQRRLSDFWAKHAEAKASLTSWYKVIRSRRWKNLAELQATFPSADYVAPYVVFNVGGNNYRVVAKVEFQFWGRATLVYTYTANGLRIDPGETVGLRFDLPKDFSGELFKFWCNVHGKLHGDVLQGEIFVVKPKHG